MIGRAAALASRTIALIGRREIVVRLRSRVFGVGTIVMLALAVAGVLAHAYLDSGSGGRPAAVNVGFSGGAAAPEPSFRSIAASLGEA